MSAQHIEVLVEEPSMKAFLRELLPRLLPYDRSFQAYPFQGKSDLLGKLPARLRLAQFRGISQCGPGVVGVRSQLQR